MHSFYLGSRRQLMRSSIEVRRLAAGALWMALAAASATCAAAAQAEPAAAAPASTPEAMRQARARTIMMNMAQFLANAPRFQVSLRSGYDVVQPSGQKIAFHEDRVITVSRPDRLRIEGTRSDGAKALTVFSGKEIVLLDYASKVYARAPQPGALDQTIVYFVRDLGMRLPLAAMLLSRLPAELQERVRSVDYVELTAVDGIPAHHIAARTDTVDAQFWVTDGAQPLPRRVVLTYKNEPGQPQFSADFSKWNLVPAIDDALFAVQAPQELQKVAFAGELARRSPSPPNAPPKKGAK
jgi:hypothetical protein